MKKDIASKLNNAGISLVELLVVIAIITIMSGGIGIGISLAFSRDAEQCATLINDALKEARTLSMSKVGNYSITFTTTGSGTTAKYVANIENADDSTQNITINLEGGDAKKIDYIKIGGTDVKTTPYKIIFDKSKGNVKSPLGNDIIDFEIKQSRGTKTAKVQLVPTTGKHTLGEFK